MMEPMVSVVVPVFRVEQYLRECIDSLLEQTFKNLEIILIDDGSDDESPAICDEYGAKYENIIVIHQNNMGVSSARNIGLKVAHGQYIAFCDSDDIMKPNMLARMVEIAQLHDVDMVMCGYETFPDGRKCVPRFRTEEALSPTELIASCAQIHSGNELCFSCRFLFRSTHLRKQNLIFNPAIAYGEDVLFNMEFFLTARKIYVINESLYCYRVHAGSAMRIKYKPKLESQLQQQYEYKIAISERFGLNDNESWMEDLAYYYITGFAGMLFRNAMNGPIEDQHAAVKRAIRLPMLAENYKRCGRRLYENGKRNAIFRLACQHRIDPIVFYFVKRIYGQS